ncbi:hypothetical protein SAMN04515695_6021 [Pseudovibrio sp. Tun.PSC04-5.I4]|nr:hypothetical protein SAMN04515695_6021 [Pseudovibrio sp. Tun.PSC04-5.I4]
MVLSGTLATALYASVALPSYVLAADINIASVTELKKPTESGYTGYDGSGDTSPAVFYLNSGSDGDTLSGSIHDGSAQMPTIYQSWDGTAYAAADADLRVSGIHSVSSFTSDVDITLNLTREQGLVSDNQSIDLTGLSVLAGKTVANRGAIDIAATGGTAANGYARADAQGISGEVGMNSGNITVTANAGAVTSFSATAPATTEAHGIFGYVGMNSGAITVTANGGTATSSTSAAYAYAYVKAHGIEGDVETNSGAITVTANGGTVPSTNDSAYASAKAYGIEGNVDTNSGNITVTVNGGTATSSSGSAYASAKAYGIDGNVDTNSGNITVTANGGTATSSNVYSSARAIGISGTVIENRGDILVKAIAGKATINSTVSSGSAYAYGIESSNGTLTNTGLIDVYAKARTDSGAVGKAEAYGIQASNDLTLDSSGLINVTIDCDGNGDGDCNDSADNYLSSTSQAYQVYANSKLSIKGYSIAFADDLALSTYEGTIKADNVADVTFDNAKLYAHTTDTTVAGQAYTIPSLVTDGTVLKPIDEQLFASIETKSLIGTLGPDWDASFVEGTSTQQVIFNYTPDVSTSQQAAVVQKNTVAHTMGVTQNALLSMMDGRTATGTGNAAKPLGYASTAPSAVQQAVAAVPDIIIGTKLETKGQIFATPYHSIQSAAANPLGYNARSSGIIAGYNHKLTPDLLVGANASMAYSRIDYTGSGYEDRSEQVKTFGAGVQGAYRSGNMLLSGISSYFRTQNDYTDTSASNSEQAEYASSGAQTALNLQYIAPLGDQKFVPEVGLTHLWLSRDAYTTDNKVNANTTHGALNEHELYASAKLSWQGTYRWEDTVLKPSLGAGIRQTLSDGKLSSSMASGANGFAVIDSFEDKTAFIASAALEVSSDTFTAALGYVGEYTKNTRDTSLYGRFAYHF